MLHYILPRSTLKASVKNSMVLRLREKNRGSSSLVSQNAMQVVDDEEDNLPSSSVEFLKNLIDLTLQPEDCKSPGGCKSLQDILMVYVYREEMSNGNGSPDNSISGPRHRQLVNLKNLYRSSIESAGCDYQGHQGFFLRNQVACLFYNQRQPTSTIYCGNPVLNTRLFVPKFSIVAKKERLEAVKRSLDRPLELAVLPTLRDQVRVESGCVKIKSGPEEKTLALNSPLLDAIYKDLTMEVSRYQKLVILFYHTADPVLVETTDILFIKRYTQQYQQVQELDTFYLVLLCAQ